MSFRHGSLFAFVLVIGSAGLTGYGCSRQPEGERCSLKNGDLDCDGGGDGTLKCVPSTNLRHGGDGVDRCCPSSNITDDRCTPGRNTGTGGSSGNEGGAGGGGGVGGADGGHDLDGSCVYNSDCKEPLVCKNSLCKYECNVDRDCLDGYRCSANQCLLK